MIHTYQPKTAKRGGIVLLALVLLVSGILVACGPAKGTAEWYALEGGKLGKEGRYDEAIEECNKAIKLAPNMAIPYNNRATAYNEMGQYDLSHRRLEQGH